MDLEKLSAFLNSSFEVIEGRGLATTAEGLGLVWMSQQELDSLRQGAMPHQSFDQDKAFIDLCFALRENGMARKLLVEFLRIGGYDEV